jgi:hypothetical protein
MSLKVESLRRKDPIDLVRKERFVELLAEVFAASGAYGR